MNPLDRLAFAPSGAGKKTGTLLLFLWCLAVLGLFSASHLELIRPFGGLARTGLLAAWIAAAIAFTGWRILRRIKPRLGDDLDPLLEFGLELGLGSGCLILALFAMGISGLYRPAAAWLLLAASMAGNPLPWLAECRRRLARLRTARPASLAALLWVLGCMTCLESLAPATSQDALVYHLAVPARYIQEGGIVAIPENFFASFPQNIEMLFTLALLVGDSGLANWMHWLLGAGAALAVAALARQLAGGAGGLLSACIFASIPTVCLIASWAYVDCGLVFFQLLAILAFLRWRRTETAAWLDLSAVFAGLAAGCKYTGGGIIILAVLGIILDGALRGLNLRPVCLRIGRYGLAAGAVAAPWFIKNWAFTGNPIYPFLYAVFGGEGWDSERSAILGLFLGEWGKGRGILETLSLPLQLTFSARFFSIENFDGMIGPVFLLGAPLAIWGFIRKPAWRWMLLFILGFALLWLMTTRQVRFLITPLAAVAAILGAGAETLLAGGVKKTIGILLLCGLWLNAGVVAARFASHNPIPVVLGFEDREGYMSREIPGGDYAVFTYINDRLPDSSLVFFGPCGNPGFLCRKRYFAEPIFESHTLKKILAASSTPDDVEREFRRRGFTHFLFRWDLVFDPSEKKSGIRLEEQQLLAAFLNQHAEPAANAGGTFLYGIGKDGAP